MQLLHIIKKRNKNSCFQEFSNDHADSMYMYLYLDSSLL